VVQVFARNGHIVVRFLPARITLAAMVTSTSATESAPTGEVKFLDRGTQIGIGQLNALEQTAFATSSFSVGVHSITAQYGGDENFVGSTSSVFTETVNLVGDVNGDGVVNCADLEIVKASFGKKTGQTGFDPRADINGDGVVNVIDLSMVAKQLPAGTVCK
jgi:hypothetical protein